MAATVWVCSSKADKFTANCPYNYPCVIPAVSTTLCCLQSCGPHAKLLHPHNQKGLVGWYPAGSHCWMGIYPGRRSRSQQMWNWWMTKKSGNLHCLRMMSWLADTQVHRPEVSVHLLCMLWSTWDQDFSEGSASTWSELWLTSEYHESPSQKAAPTVPPSTLLQNLFCCYLSYGPGTLPPTGDKRNSADQNKIQETHLTELSELCYANSWHWDHREEQ